MTDSLPARLRDAADGRVAVPRPFDGATMRATLAALLREAAAEIERLTTRLALSEKAYNDQLTADEPLALHSRTLAAEQRADTAERLFGDAQHHAYSEKQERRAAEARCAALTEALDPLSDHAYRFRAYPQGLAGQDQLVGVYREDITTLRELAKSARALLAPSGGEPT